MTQAATSVEDCWRRALQQQEGLSAYKRLASWEPYETALYWLRLGYFDRDAVVEQLEDELEEVAREVIEHAVAAASAILVLDQGTWARLP